MLGRINFSKSLATCTPVRHTHWTRPVGRTMATLVLTFGLYMQVHAGLVASPSPATPIELTANEQAWIAQRHTVRARVGEYPPYMFKQPELEGIAVDVLANVAQRYGFKVEFLTNTTGFPAAVEDVAGPRQNYDLLLTFTRTPEREKQFAITSDYLKAPWVIYARRDSPYIVGLESLAGKTVAAEKGFVITSKLRSDYPEIRVLETALSPEALIAVATGRADAYVGNLANASYLIKERRLDNLVVAAPAPFGINTQAMAVRRDWPELASIIDKGIAAMPKDERNAINQKWGSIEVRSRIDYTLVWQAILLSSLVFVSILYWNHRRSTLILRASEARLRRAEDISLSGNWELHLPSREIHASDGATRIYGLPQGRFDLTSVQAMALPEYRPYLDAKMKTLIESGAGYDVEFKIRAADTGAIKDIQSQASLDRSRKVVFGVIHDVTVSGARFP